MKKLILAVLTIILLSMTTMSLLSPAFARDDADRIVITLFDPGVWQSDSEGARIPEVDIEVQIELVPKVLNLESKGYYFVFMTFPNDEKLGELSGKTVMQKFPTQSLNLDEVKGVESGTEVTFTVQGQLGTDGEIFGSSLEGTINNTVGLREMFEYTHAKAIA